MKQPPTVEELRQLLRIEGGQLFWIAGRRAGRRAGCDGGMGYRQVWINGVICKEHRVVFALANGRWPEKEIDHINLVRDDNRPENLREVDRLENLQKRTRQRNNTSGFKGAWWNKVSGSWYATISINGKLKYLGSYGTAEEAGEAYLRAARKKPGYVEVRG